MQQRISTPSVINILDSVILSSTGYSLPPISPRDPFEEILSKLEPYALDPETVVAALRDALTDPNADNPLVTVSHYENRFGTRGFVLVGPNGSEADFITSDQTGFATAIHSLPPSGGCVLVLPGTYTFTDTLIVPNNVRLIGIHPSLTTISGIGDFPLLLVRDNSAVERLSVDGSGTQNEATVFLSGRDSQLRACRIYNFNRLGVQMLGLRSQVSFCKIESNATHSYTSGVMLQGIQQMLNACSFYGPLNGGAAVFESKECGLLYSFFASDVAGPAFKLSSPSLTDNRIVGNHFDSALAITASVDYGTGTVRYSNTPNTLALNLNNALDPLKNITGQPSVTSNEMVLSNSFTHDPSSEKDAASLFGKLDFFLEKSYEHRNWSIDCSDPVFDGTGAPVSGVFTWDGSTLTYPEFSWRSIHTEDVIATFSPGSLVVPPNHALVINSDVSPPLTVRSPDYFMFSGLTSYGLIRYGNSIYPTSSGVLSEASFSIGKFLATDGTVEARLYAADQSTKLPTTLLATSVALNIVDLPDQPGPEAWTTFTFSSSPTVTAGTYYALIVVISGVPTGQSVRVGQSYAWTNQPYLSYELGATQFTALSVWSARVSYKISNLPVPEVKPLLLGLNQPNDSTYMVLIYVRPSGEAVWLDGKRILPNSAFDVQGDLVPLTRYIGVSESRNPAPIFDGFGAESAANVTTKLGAHSALLQNAVERTNLQYTTETTDCRISTDPEPGDWYSASVILNGLPSAPTHLLNVQGTLYGLVPTSGVYYFDRPSDGWRLVNGNPAGTGPFVSLSRYQTGLALLLASGNVVAYSPESGWSAVFTNQLTNVSVPMATTGPSAGWYDAGQADFAMQTENYTIFTTVGGETLRFNAERLTLEKMPRVFTEAAGTESGLITYHPRDTGYNMAMDPETLGFSGDNGGHSKLTGLPLSRFFHGQILVDNSLPQRSTLLSLDWSTIVVENYAFCQPNGSFMLIACNSARSTFYVFIGGPGIARLVSVLTPAPTLTPMSWVLNPLDQAIYLLGTTSSNALAMYRGAWTSTNVPSDQGWGAGRFTFSLETIDSGTYTGVIAGLDLFNQDEGTRDLIALATDSARSNRPTWFRYSRTTQLWTKKTLTDETPVAATDVQTTWAVANISGYNYASDQTTPGNGVASPISYSFLIKSGLARSGRPTLFRWVRSSDSFDSAALGGTDGISMPVADSNGYVQGLGAIYHPTFKALMWLGKAATNQVKLYTLFESAAATPTVWSGVSIGASGATYLSTVNLGTYSVIRRSGAMLSRTLGDRYLGTDSVSEDVYFYAPSQGIIRGVLNGGVTGFTSQTWSVVNKRTTTDPLIFSNTPTNTYSPFIGSDRMGDMSFQFGSLAEPTLPLHGYTMNGRAEDYEGLLWVEPGTILKNLGLPFLWAGVNRSGYLWVGTARSTVYGPIQVEYSPNTVIRGDVTLTGLPAINDFDWAMNGDQSKVGICFRSNVAPTNIYLATYDIPTETLTLERGGVEITGTAVVSLSSTPQIAYNSVANSWDIVAQDDTRAGGQFVFYRKSLTTNTWLGERIGSGGDKLTSLGSQALKTPTRPCIMPNGNVLVIGENNTGNAQIVARDQATGVWSSVWTSTIGGFSNPVIARAGNYYYACGGAPSASGNSIAQSMDGSAWFLRITPGSPKTSIYCRVRFPSVYSTNDGIYVASPLISESGTTANQELGVFSLSNTSGLYGAALAAKSRCSQLLSGAEELNYQIHSWTYKGDLLYAATRPGKSAVHWSIRRSLNNWKFHGESVNGPGRMVAHGPKQYRESLTSINQSLNWAITEWPSLTSVPILPLGSKKRGQIFGLRWFVASVSSQPLFLTTDLASALSETTLPTGSMNDVSARPWPRVLGNTHGILSGGAVLGSGAGARLTAPIGVTDASYFGATIPSSGMLRLQAKAALTFYGTHTFRSSDSERSYTITGPYTILLTQEGQHLVLDFPVSSSLVLDPSSNPLSYWVDYEHPVSRYAIVLGQNKNGYFLLAPELGGMNLVHGHLEPRELSALDVSYENRRPYPIVSDFPFTLDQIPTGNSGEFKFKIIGSNHGIQATNFGTSSLKQLLIHGPLALGFCFLETVTDRLKASSRLVRPVLTAHTSGGVVVLGE